ncbi:MAG: hypothetical protein SFY67_12020 [Candidatus Melainabacteria bacterium]|nr:hypothetical protein [Candidatus Melainabacteria bacterium]
MTSVFTLLWEEGNRFKRKNASSSAGKPKTEIKSRWSKGPRIKVSKIGKMRYGGYLSDKGSRTNAIVKSKYVRRGSDSQRHMLQHVFYISKQHEKEHEREHDPRRFFSKDRLGVDRDDVLKHLVTHQGKEVSMHKMILSPGDNAVNILDYTRESMEKLEQTLGYKVDWFAVEHKDTDHKHAHVVIAGKIPEHKRLKENQEKELEVYLSNWAQHMQGKDLKLSRDHLDSLRVAGNEYLLKERSIDRELDHAIEREFGLNDWTYDRRLEKELGIKLEYQDKEYVERELGLSSKEKDERAQLELGLNTDRQNWADNKDIGLGQVYDLSRPYLDDRSANYLYKIGQSPEQEILKDNLSETLLSEQNSSQDREIPFETNLPQLLLDMRANTRSEQELERGEDLLSTALYHEHEHEHIEHSKVIEMKIFDSAQSKPDQDRTEDDNRSPDTQGSNT